VAGREVENRQAEVSRQFQPTADRVGGVNGTEFHSVNRESVLRQNVAIRKKAQKVPPDNRALGVLQSVTQRKLSRLDGFLDPILNLRNVFCQLLLHRMEQLDELCDPATVVNPHLCVHASRKGIPQRFGYLWRYGVQKLFDPAGRRRLVIGSQEELACGSPPLVEALRTVSEVCSHRNRMRVATGDT